MSTTKKERWTEAEVLALPAGEHDYFDRKSGALLDGPEYRIEIAKALCAFANSGGGYLVLGMTDDKRFDGVQPARDRTPTRERLEQIIPNLLSYPLQDFRVHEVIPASPSEIPEGKVVIVIDVGDSVLAPHQSVMPANKPTYYHRSAGHSLPAPHFYLEMLRNRLTAPMLEPELIDVRFLTHQRKGNDLTRLQIGMTFRVTNVGRVAAYEWTLLVEQPSGMAEGRESDYLFPFEGLRNPHDRSPKLQLNRTVLPSLWEDEERTFDVIVRPDRWSAEALTADFHRMLPPTFQLRYRAISEMSPGSVVETKFHSVPRSALVLSMFLQYA